MPGYVSEQNSNEMNKTRQFTTRRPLSARAIGVRVPDLRHLTL